LNRQAEAEGLARVNHKRVYRVMKRAGLLLEPHTGRGLVSTIRPPAAAQILQADQARAHSVLQAPRHLGRGGRRGGRGAARAASPRRETPLPVVLDVILPIFGLLAFGYGATFTRVFGEAAATALASFVFYFAIPVMLFRSMATPVIGPSSTSGATTPVCLSPAMKVVVRQWPCGTAATRRSPSGLRP
jgi:hypothetical protein